MPFVKCERRASVRDVCDVSEVGDDSEVSDADAPDNTASHTATMHSNTRSLSTASPITSSNTALLPAGA